MRIAIFDYRVIAGNPSGRCHLILLRALAQEHDFTVFSVEFENPDPQRIKWVPVRVPTRPLFLLFLAFHIVAPSLYLWRRLWHGERFYLIQSVESNLLFGKLIYSHFSHRSYLRHHVSPTWSVRTTLHWVDHKLHAWCERHRYQTAELIVTPSKGLARELIQEFSLEAARVQVIANPVPVKEMQPPKGFDRAALRADLRLGPATLVLLFSALGDFERKGLPLLLNALRSPKLRGVTLLVVGGEPNLVAVYRKKAEELRVERQVLFLGKQRDVRPFNWIADAFVLPSEYETFSLAAYEAAAASLPIIAPPLHGVRDLLRDGVNGFVVDRNCESLSAALIRMESMSDSQRECLGRNAASSAAMFSEENFVSGWRALYAEWNHVRALGAPSYGRPVHG